MNIQTIQQIIHQKNQNLSIVWQILEAVKIHAVHFQPSGPVHPCIHRAVSAASRTPGDRPALIFNQIASDVIVIILVNMGNQGREYGKPRPGIWEIKAGNMGNQGREYGKPRQGIWETKVGNMGNQGREYGKPRQGIWETKIVNMGNQGREYGKPRQ